MATRSTGYLRSGRWVPLLAFVVLMAVACVLLGRWQVDRLEQRRVKNAAIVAAEQQAPVSVRTLVTQSADEPIGFRQVVVEGTWGPQSAVRNRSFDGTNGAYVIAPLRTGDEIVWIVRGWVPPGPDARTPPVLPDAPEGRVRVEGLARVFESPSGGGLPPGFVGRIAPEDLAATGPATTVPFWLQATAEDPAPEAAIARLPAPELSEGPHLGYAIQWGAFAIMALVGGVVLVRRQRAFYLEDIAAAEAAAEPLLGAPAASTSDADDKVER